MKSICDVYLDSHWLKITSIIEATILENCTSKLNYHKIYLPVNVGFWFNEIINSI